MLIVLMVLFIEWQSNSSRVSILNCPSLFNNQKHMRERDKKIKIALRVKLREGLGNFKGL